MDIFVIDLFSDLFDRPDLSPIDLARAVQSIVDSDLDHMPAELFSEGHDITLTGPHLGFLVEDARFENDDLLFSFVWNFGQSLDNSPDSEPPNDDSGDYQDHVEVRGKFLVRLHLKTLAVWEDTTIEVTNPDPDSKSI